MNKELMIFKNKEFGKVRTLKNEDGQIYFVAKDVAEVLGYTKLDAMYRRLSDKQKLRINPQNLENTRFPQNVVIKLEENPNVKNMVLITEGGLYKAILGSRLSDAERFQDWVTDEVLPAIRKNGTYTAKPLSPMDQLRLQYEVLEDHSDRLSKLESNMVIEHGQAVTIKKLVNKRVKDILGEAYTAKSLIQKSYKALWRDYKGYFNLTNYHNTLKKDFEEAVELVESWKPNGELLRVIRNEQMQCRI